MKYMYMIRGSRAIHYSFISLIWIANLGTINDGTKIRAISHYQKSLPQFP